MPKKAAHRNYKTPDQIQFDFLIGINISKYRGFNRMSQKDLAERILISTQTLSEWENGKQSISAYHLKQIAKTFNIKVEDLLFFEDERKFS